MHMYIYIYMYTYIPVDILRRTWAARFSNRILGEVLSLLYIYIDVYCFLNIGPKATGHQILRHLIEVPLKLQKTCS